MSRLGLAVPGFHAFSPDEYVTFVREAEGRGYDTAWIGETVGADAIALMTFIAAQTERLRVANGVIPIQVRPPTIFAMAAATLGRLAPGRVALGLGLSSPVVVGDWHGLNFTPVLGQIREAVQIIRMALAGERVSFEGKFYRVKNFRLGIPTPSVPVKIYLSALGPKALELAGEIADGVLLNWIPPEVVPRSIARLEAGARRAGRNLSDFEIAAFVRTCVTDDVATARQFLAREITGYVTVDAYARFFRDSGFASEVEAMSAAWKAGDRAGAVKNVSSRFLDGLSVVGSEDFCRARIAEFARAGLTMPVVMPVAPEAATGGDPRPTLLRTMRTFP